jgi:RHS repeat-associated protein
MKKHLLIKGALIVVLNFSVFLVYGQRPVPSTYSTSMPVNYVRTWDAKAPQKDPNKILVTASVDSFIMTTLYADGLGRPIQTVVKGITPLGNDMVTSVIYDEFGREQFKYLPFVANNTGGNTSVSDGLFKLNPFQQQAAFFDNANSISPIKGQAETFFYSQTVFESSPLNRVTNTYAPGNNWVGNQKGVGQEYLFNTVSDSVRIWIAGINPSDIPTTTVIYNAGQLYKNQTTDENGKKIVEYKDKEGKVVLKKVQLENNPGTAHMGWLCTYYVYDDFGNLRFVLQPKAVETLLVNGNWNISAAVRDELCFYYGYDARLRMTTKKVPGAGEVYMIYDTRDRLLYTQDANMRAKNWWLATVYDVLNRPALTAMLLSGTRSAFQSFADNEANLSGTTTLTTQGSNLPSNLVFSLRQAGRTLYQASQTIEFKDGFNSEAGAEFIAEINASYTSAASSVVASSTPFPSTISYKALTITSYDDYSQTNKNFSTLNNPKLTNSSNFFPEPLPSTNSLQTKGMVTSSKVWVLEDANLLTGRWLESVSFYNERARVVQVQSDNASEGKDTLTSLYDFSGELLCTYMAHQNPNADIFSVRVKTNTQYDKAGRIVSVIKGLNDLSSTGRIVSDNSYDELGQLKIKKYYKQNTGVVMESQTYDYNIRGWMLGANRDYAKSTSSASNYFGFDLAYDKQTIQPVGGSSIGSYAANQLNGNISGMLWKSTGDDEIRKYDFTYDAMNRLTGADFNQYSGGFNKNAGVDFSVTNLSYDANGNILSLWQKGWKLTGSDFIDKLSYNYNSYSNKLKNVVDAVQDKNTKLGDFRYSSLYESTISQNKASTATDYTYDDNGNLKKDLNKDIGTAVANGVSYNHLNLPSVITVEGKGTIQYIYDATGNKLKKITTEGAKLTTTVYLFGNYVNDTLQFLPQEEGRIRPTTDNTNPFAYDYFIKDHLGNVRMMLTDEQKQDQYPAATMETATRATEEMLYSNMSSTRVDRPQNYPTFNSDPTINLKVAKVNGSGNKIGPAIILKVMAGDKFNVMVNSWYLNTQKNTGLPITTPGVPVNPLTDLVNALTSSIPLASHGTISQTDLNNINTQLQSQSQQFLNTQNNYETYRPKAFLNWILFDERMQYVQSSSGFEQVPDESVYENHTVDAQTYQHVKANLPIDKNGYLYIYVSNETPNIDVFFDNLQVTHVRGPLSEETHYYPFGLAMSGISSEALNFGQPENKKKYNGIEKEDALELNIYDAQFRELDPQTARWWQIDPVTDGYENLSPYASMYDNPITVSDPLGNEGENCCWDAVKAWVADKVENPSKLVLWTETARQNWNALSETVSTAVDNAVTNFKNGNDGFHQMMANPMSMVTGMGPLSMSKGLLMTEANATKTLINTEVKTLANSEAQTSAKVLSQETEIVQRAMSKAELKSTENTGLFRGGREGTHYASNAIGNDAKRVRQRLALPQTPEVKVSLRVPKGTFSSETVVDPKYNMPGGGKERTAVGNVPVEIIKVTKLK